MGKKKKSKIVKDDDEIGPREADRFLGVLIKPVGKSSWKIDDKRYCGDYPDHFPSFNTAKRHIKTKVLPKHPELKEPNWFEVYKSNTWYVRFRSKNGKTLMDAGGYNNKRDAVHVIKLVAKRTVRIDFLLDWEIR